MKPRRVGSLEFDGEDYGNVGKAGRRNSLEESGNWLEIGEGRVKPRRVGSLEFDGEDYGNVGKAGRRNSLEESGNRLEIGTEWGRR